MVSDSCSFFFICRLHTGWCEKKRLLLPTGTTKRPSSWRTRYSTSSRGKGGPPSVNVAHVYVVLRYPAIFGYLSLQLTELEERAEELDKKRTSSIATVALINDRNRKANVSKAEVYTVVQFIPYASISFKLNIAGSHPARDHSQKGGGRRV